MNARRAQTRAYSWPGPLLALLASFVLLSAAYSVATPIFEAPDELQHYATAQYIARHAALPLLTLSPP